MFDYLLKLNFIICHILCKPLSFFYSVTYIAYVIDSNDEIFKDTQTNTSYDQTVKTNSVHCSHVRSRKALSIIPTNTQYVEIFPRKENMVEKDWNIYMNSIKINK